VWHIANDYLCGCFPSFASFSITRRFCVQYIWRISCATKRQEPFQTSQVISPRTAYRASKDDGSYQSYYRIEHHFIHHNLIPTLRTSLCFAMIILHVQTNNLVHYSNKKSTAVFLPNSWNYMWNFWKRFPAIQNCHFQFSYLWKK